MTVFQIIPFFNGYGTDRLVVDMHRLFLNAGIKSCIICLSGEVPRGLSNAYSLDAKNPYDPRVVVRLADKLAGNLRIFSVPDIIHVHLTPCQLMVPFVARLAKRKTLLVTTEHSTLNRRRYMIGGRLIDFLLFRQYQKIICISNAVKVEMETWQPFLKDKLTVINNGINLQNFANEITEKPSPNKTIIISVGRLVPEKNYPAAIKACTRLKDLDFEYRIIGAGPEEQALRNLISELEMENSVKLMGFQANVSECLIDANIFLMPSLWEGFGLSAVEAMAVNLPIVVSDVPGVREIIDDDGKCGFLIRVADPDDIADKLRQLIVNPELCVKMGRYAQIRSRIFNIEKTVRDHIALYEEMLAF